jgi:hypothetical protein
VPPWEWRKRLTWGFKGLDFKSDPPRQTINEPGAHRFRVHPPTEVELVHVHANFRLLQTLGGNAKRFACGGMVFFWCLPAFQKVGFAVFDQ